VDTDVGGAVHWLMVLAEREAVRQAGRPAEPADAALDAHLERLHDLITAGLGYDPFRDLVEEVGAGPYLERRRRAESAIRGAAEEDPPFGAAIAEVLAALGGADDAVSVERLRTLVALDEKRANRLGGSYRHLRAVLFDESDQSRDRRFIDLAGSFSTGGTSDLYEIRRRVIEAHVRRDEALNHRAMLLGLHGAEPDRPSHRRFQRASRSLFAAFTKGVGGVFDLVGVTRRLPPPQPVPTGDVWEHLEEQFARVADRFDVEGI
jgi:hypothetical protein